MIPYLPQGSSNQDALAFYGQILENLELRSSHHEAWHTHKRDPSVCWICDLLELSKSIKREMEMFISKSALDIDEQSYSSVDSPEDESLLEEFNYDEENPLSYVRESSDSE